MARNDFEDFNRLSSEFDNITSNRRISSGLSSLVMLSEREKNSFKSVEMEEGGLYSYNPKKSGLGIVSRMDVENIDPANFDVLTDKLKKTTLNVRLKYAFTDLLDPLFTEMQINRIEQHTNQSEFHREIMFQLRTIVASMEEGTNSTMSLINRMMFNYRTFMRNPVWNSIDLTLSLLHKTLVKPLTWTLSKLMFGFGNKEDPVVKAINEQTEFMRKGLIDNEQGFLERLARGGLTGLAGEGLGALVGVGQKKAQANEDAWSRGEEAQSNVITGWLNKKFFGDKIIKRGRQGGMNDRGDIGSSPDEQSDPMFNEVHQARSILETLLDRFTSFNTLYQNSLGVDQVQMDELLSYQRKSSHSIIDAEEWKEREEERSIDHLNSQKKLLNETEHTNDYLRRIRSGQILQTITGVLSNLGSTIVSGVTSAFTSSASVIGGAMAGGLVAKGSSLRKALGFTARFASGMALPIAVTGIAGYALTNLVKAFLDDPSTDTGMGIDKRVENLDMGLDEPLFDLPKFIGNWFSRGSQTSLPTDSMTPAERQEYLMNQRGKGVIPSPPKATGITSSSLVDRIIHQESRNRQFNRRGDPSSGTLESSAGAVGLMQIMPSTAPDAARIAGVPFDENKYRNDRGYNKMIGTAYLNHLLERYDGNEVLASSAYNGGMGNVDKWVDAFGDPRKGEISNSDFINKIPFKETRNYARNVTMPTSAVPSSQQPSLNLPSNPTEGAMDALSARLASVSQQDSGGVQTMIGYLSQIARTLEEHAGDMFGGSDDGTAFTIMGK